MIDFNEIEKRLEEELAKETPSTINAFLFEETYGHSIDTEKFDVDFDIESGTYIISALDYGEKELKRVLKSVSNLTTLQYLELLEKMKKKT